MELKHLAVALLSGFLALWVVLVIVLVVGRPKGSLLREALRILPDTLRLIYRLAADRSQPRGIRVRLWLLLGYLSFPLDLIPDFVPVVGHADDAIIACLVLRAVVRRAGPEAISRQWPGTEDGLRTLWRVARLPGRPPAPTG